MSGEVLIRRAGRLVATGLILAAAVAGLSVASAALFTDLEPIAGNTFSTGTVIIDASPATAAFSVPAMQPGGEVTAEIVAANTGSTQFRYAVTSTTTEDVLAAELVLTIRENVTTCDTVDWDATGIQIYQGPLGDTTTTDGLPLIGNAATGADSGDRTLNPAANETLCFHVTLPQSSTIQNTITTATFNFLAEQTANN